MHFVWSHSETNMLCLDQTKSQGFMFLWFEQKKKSRCPLLTESLLEHSLFSGFWTFLQHMGFFDTTSDKTKQQISTARLTSKSAILWHGLWINELVVVGVRGSEGSVLSCSVCLSPLL